MIALIVAKSDTGLIGLRSGLPWRLKADMQHVRKITMGSTLIMGRKTFDSIIAMVGHPLPGRQTVVVTRQLDFSYDGVQVIHDIDEITKLPGDVFVFGGAEIYALALPYVERLYITEVHTDGDGDVYFPSYGTSQWRETSRETYHADADNEFDYDFVVYDRA